MSTDFFTSQTSPGQAAEGFGHAQLPRRAARTARDPAFATTLANGLTVLQCFHAGNPSLANKDLVSLTGLSKGTVSRLTHTLIEKGLLLHEAHSRRYRLGAGVLGIAYPLLASLRARQVARPFMQNLARQSGGTVSMGLYDGSHMVYVETVRGHDLHAFRPDIGARLPLAVTAMGKAWYTQASVEERESAILEMQGSNSAPWVDMAAASTQACEDFQRKGYCTSFGDWHPDVHAIAAPLSVPVDGDRLILNCGVKVSQLRGRPVDGLYGEKLLATVKKIDAALATVSQRHASDELPPNLLPDEAMDEESPLNERLVDPQFAMTLANGIEVLGCFQRGETTLGNKDFSERTGLSPSTIARLTHTLVQLGYLRRMPGRTKYRPGLALLTVAYPLLASMQLRQLARPLMRDLAEDINGAVSLVVQDRCRMIHVETSRANESMATYPDIGSSMPMLSTAAGKAWLCHAPIEQQERTLNRLRIRSPRHYERYFPLLDAARHEFEKTGCCSSQGQWRKDVYGFATPFRRSLDSMTFVFNCGVPSSNGAFHDRRNEITPRLLELTRRVETFLGNL